jgi:hypothetical protein
MKLIIQATFFISATLLLVNASSCDGGKKNDTRLKIINNSNDTIVVMNSYNYPDSINYVLNSCRVEDKVYHYKPNTDDYYLLFGSNWDKTLEKIPSRTMMLLIYNIDTARYYYDITGDCSMLNGKESKRVDITMDYLNHNGYSITYP